MTFLFLVRLRCDGLHRAISLPQGYSTGGLCTTEDEKHRNAGPILWRSPILDREKAFGQQLRRIVLRFIQGLGTPPSLPPVKEYGQPYHPRIASFGKLKNVLKCYLLLNRPFWSTVLWAHFKS